jgi:phage tail sheath protein FI/predicted transcriptional regulator
MAYSRPDIYIEEVSTPDTTGTGVTTSIPAFLGATERGPSDKPTLITSMQDFKRVFGGVVANEPLFYSVRSFFQNGGASCYVVRIYSAASTPIAANETINNTSATGLLKFSFGYRGDEVYGTAGVGYKVKLRLSSNFNSAYVAGTTYDVKADATVGMSTLQVSSVNGIKAGSVINVVETVAGGGTDNYLIVKSVSSVVDSGVLKHYVELTAGLTSEILGPDSQIHVLEYSLKVLDQSGVEVESWTGLNLNPDSDEYIETLVNDSEVGSRYVIVEDLQPVGVMSAKEINVAVLNASYDMLDNDGASELTNFAIGDLIGTSINKRGIQSLNGKTTISLLCVPPSLAATGILTTTLMPQVHAEMLSFCGARMNMFAVLDAPIGLNADATDVLGVGTYRTSSLGVDSHWGALYYPHLVVRKESSKQTIQIPPSGAVAGVYARVDSISPPSGGISTSPAGQGEFGLIKEVVGLERNPTDAEHGALNVLGVNCLRNVNRANGSLPGTLVLGARTLSSTTDFRYINVRRMMTFIEQNVKQIARPSLFRNNGSRLWASLTTDIESFLSGLFANGELAGNTEKESFFVKIDKTNNPNENIQQGILIAEIGVAILRPAEFMVFRFSQSQTGTTIEEQ